MSDLTYVPGAPWPPQAAPGKSPLLFAPELLLWMAALVSFPFYVMSSGSMQISSVLLLLTMAATLLQLRRRGLPLFSAESLPLVKMLAAFVFYAAVLSLVWAIVLSDLDVAAAPGYYTFNLMVVILVTSLYRLHGLRLIRLTRWVIFGSIALQFCLSFTFADRGFRELLFFNNANQLGYYALVCASIMALPLRAGSSRLQQIVFSIGILMCTWLALLSLSKAATISTVVFLFLAGSRNWIQLWIGSMVVLMLMTFDLDQVTTRVDNLTVRFESFGEEGGDETFEGRGYDRIWENPEMLIVGAAEHGNYRWANSDQNIELHSTIGTLVFSYGIPGVLLMGGFLAVILRTGGWRIVPFMIPEFMFSVTHMGLRFVMTWVYFLMLFLVALEWRRERQSSSAALLQ
ncbi:MAG TPA: hypothetical protein VM074_09335 [Solimonas sp.]|nr:hypothetical protein [Solimonas sp.]